MPDLRKSIAAETVGACEFFAGCGILLVHAGARLRLQTKQAREGLVRWIVDWLTGWLGGWLNC
jgi:hypothetical protein